MAERWEDTAFVGKHLGRHDYAVDEAAIAHYIASTGDDHPWYTGESPFGGPVAPALLLSDEQYRFPLREWYLPKLFGNLHIKQEWDLFGHVAVGSQIHTLGTIVDRYIRRDRDVVVQEFLVFDERGAMVSRGRCHQSFLLDIDEGGTVVGKGPQQKHGQPRGSDDAAEPIEVIEPVERRVTLDLCMAYSGPNRNYHNDREEAAKLGFPDVVVQGTLSTTFISEMLTRRYGAGWLEGGRMSLNLINVLWGGETVTARGVVRETRPEGRRIRHVLDVWTEKPDGTKTIAGSASALAG
jgi:acyl dehydratase